MGGMKTSMWIGYGLITVGIALGWALSSPNLVGVCVFMALVLTLATNVDFSRLTAKVPGGELEVRREVEKRRQLEMVAEEASKKAQDPDLVELTQPTRQPDAEVWPRELIERLITVAAQWGWSMSALGWTSPPEPIIEWTKDGAPQIIAGRASLETEGELRPTGTVETKVIRGQ